MQRSAIRKIPVLRSFSEGGPTSGRITLDEKKKCLIIRDAKTK